MQLELCITHLLLKLLLERYEGQHYLPRLLLFLHEFVDYEFGFLQRLGIPEMQFPME